MDSWFVNHSFKKWLKAVVSVGNNLIELSNNRADLELTSTYEHFFVIAVGKSLEWGAELEEFDTAKFQTYCTYKENLPEARLVRNMREHDVAYLNGEGRRQQEFVAELSVNNGNLTASVDGTSTIICDEGYLIGGRLNVQDTVAHAQQALSEI